MTPTQAPLLAPTSIAALRAKGARCPKLDIIQKEWGAADIPVTAENLRRAAVLGLDLDWWANQWLPPLLWAEYLRLHQAGPLWAEYLRQEAELLIQVLGLDDGGGG